VPTTGTEPEPLRVRRRRLLQDEIERVAIRLFLERGFDAVSVDDIAAAAGMSGRTFFRYYSTKDEILRRYQAGLTDALFDAFAAQPASSSALDALRAAYAATSDVPEPDRARVRALGRLLTTVPAVHARSVGEAQLDDRITAEYSRRDRTRRDDLRPAVIVAAVSAAAQVGWTRWVHGRDQRAPSSAVTAAIDALGFGGRR